MYTLEVSFVYRRDGLAFYSIQIQMLRNQNKVGSFCSMYGILLKMSLLLIYS